MAMTPSLNASSLPLPIMPCPQTSEFTETL
jgi:hypothetical protein